MTKDEKEKKKKPKQKFLSIIKNNFFMLKLVHKAAPGYIFIYLTNTALWATLDFISYSYMLRYVMNGIQNGLSFKKIAVFIIVLLGINITMQVWSRLWWNIISPRMSYKINAGVSKMIYRKSMSVELACYEDTAFYDKYVKATDAAGSKPYDVLNSFEMLIYSILNISLNTFMIFLIEPMIIFFAFIPLIASLADRRRKKLSYDRKMAQKPINRRKNYTRRTFYLNDFAKEIRLFDMYRVMFKQFGDTIKDSIDVSKKYGWKIGALGFIKDSATNILSVLGATTFVAYRTLAMGVILIGDAFVVINSLSSITWTLNRAASTLLEFGEHSLYIENLNEYLSYEPKIYGGERNINRGDLDIRNVSFRYEGAQVDVLQNINMHISQGEKIAIVGQNGSGKTTLVKLLLRLYDPTDGTIELDGHNIKEYKLDEYRQSYSVVFQDFKVFSLTVAENILLRRLREGDEAGLEEATKESGAYDKINTLKNKFETILTREFDDKGEILSGGEYQKLQVARVFTEDGGVIILDEPSSALDPIAEYKMYENMLAARGDRSLIFISHRLSSAVIADRIYMLDHGMIIESGTHAELMIAGGKYADMFNKQAANYV